MAKVIRKQTPLAERVQKVKEINELRKTMSVADACKQAGVKQANYNNWNKAFAAPLNKRVAAQVVPTKQVTMNISGTTDMMFVGFGKSQDVLRAIDGLSAIFSAQN